MSSIEVEETIITGPDGFSLGRRAESIQAGTGLFTTDCLVGGVSIAGNIANTASHISATAAHGATGQVVGTTNTQTLTNKTIGFNE